MFEGIQKGSSLLAGFTGLKQERWQQSPLWLDIIREEGRRFFEKTGLPHRRVEEWKYTDVSALANQDFAPPAPLQQVPGNEALDKVLLSQTLSPLRMVFVNGFHSPALSTLENLPENVTVSSLADALQNKQDLPLLEKHLGAYALPEQNLFVALNNAFIEDGAWINVPAGVRVEQPLHLVYLSSGNQSAAHHPRNLVIVESGSSLSIIEEYIGNTDTTYFNNPVTEISMGDDTEVTHYKLQRESRNAYHIANIQVQQGERSRYVSQSVSLGAQLTRNDINSGLTGPDSHCALDGLYIIRDSQHVDNHTMIHHDAPHCTSSEVYHGILDNKSRGVFNGKIYVEKSAQKTDSKQTSRALMLSNDSRVDAKPQLEIFADDVKCTHGATVGQLDEDSLYYLQTRGISTDDARKMLTLGFAQQVTENFDWEPLREALDAFLSKELE